MVRHVSYVVALVRHALTKGAQYRSPSLYEWDVAGNCQKPHVCEIEGREDAPVRVRHDPWDGPQLDVDWYQGKFTFPDLIRPGLPITLQVHMRCRKCVPCLKVRAKLWRERAESEIRSAERTWFGTLTLTPEHHYRAEVQASVRLSIKGVDLWKLSQDEQFRERDTEIFAEITKWIKRIRKESGATLRYCLVAESHKSGLPHYHILIHERGGSVGERTLRKQWHLGHSLFKLVRDARAAAYVTKYLTKSAQVRVRASLRYGRTHALEAQFVADKGASGTETNVTTTPHDDDANSMEKIVTVQRNEDGK